MSQCSKNERKLLDLIKRADAVFILADGGFENDEDGPTTITWLRGFSERPAANFEIDYGHLPGENGEKYGKRLVRRVKVTMGLTAKEFAAAVQRGQQHSEPGPNDTPSPGVSTPSEQTPQSAGGEASSHEHGKAGSA